MTEHFKGQTEPLQGVMWPHW